MSNRQFDLLTAGLALAGGFAVLALSVILFQTPPADGFEFSVYRGYPLYFWVIAIGGLLCGQAVIVRHALGDESTSPSWRPGFVVIATVQALLFLLPYFRGYVSYDRADVLTHVGFIKNIQQMGLIPPTDIYPNIHLLTLTLSYATGVEPLRIINTVSVVIPVFSLVAWYALVARLFDRRPALLTLPFAAVLIGGSAYTNPSPYAMSTQLVPFVLYLFVRMLQTRTLASKFALALTVVSVVIYHPLTTLFLIVGLVIYGGVHVVRRAGLLAGTTAEEHGLTGTKVTTQLAFGVLVGWYFQFTPILNKTGQVVRRLLTRSEGQSQFESYTATVSETSPALVDIVVVALADYGITAVFLVLGGLYVLKLLADVWRGRGDELRTFEIAFAVAFVFFSMLSVLFLLFDLVVGWGRVLTFVRFFGVLLVGLLFHQLYQRAGARGIVTGLLVISLASVAAFGTTDLYHSPMKATASHQVTESDVDGATWVLDHRDRYTPHVDQGIELYRFGDMYYGTNKSEPRQRVQPQTPLPPRRFGYANNSTLGASYEEEHYLVVTERGREFYPEMYPTYRNSWRFYPSDYERLERDGNVLRLYDNGPFDFYLVRAAA